MFQQVKLGRVAQTIAGFFCGAVRAIIDPRYFYFDSPLDEILNGSLILFLKTARNKSRCTVEIFSVIAFHLARNVK